MRCARRSAAPQWPHLRMSHEAETCLGSEGHLRKRDSVLGLASGQDIAASHTVPLRFFDLTDQSGRRYSRAVESETQSHIIALRDSHGLAVFERPVQVRNHSGWRMKHPTSALCDPLHAAKGVTSMKRSTFLVASLVLAASTFVGAGLPQASASGLGPGQGQPQTAAEIRGVVLDGSGGAIPGATITATSAGGARTTMTDATGQFVFQGARLPATLVVTVDNFAPTTVAVDTAPADLRVVLQPVPVVEAVTVTAPTLTSLRTTTATRTETPLRDVPQSVSVIDRGLIADQTMRSMADVVNYVPGVGMAQGEGHRDAPVFRGNTSTSDFFVDGMRDDTQYLRDLYNVERVEVLKRPNGMIFGRGGVGGVINRVTRQADWMPSREVTLQGGSWGHRRLTADI